MFAEDGMFRKAVKWLSITLGALLVLFVVVAPEGIIGLIRKAVRKREGGGA